jgi:hypothetical protein
VLVVEVVEVTDVVGATVVVGFGVLVVVAVIDVVVDDGSATASESLAHAASINESARTSIDMRFIVC